MRSQSGVIPVVLVLLSNKSTPLLFVTVFWVSTNCKFLDGSHFRSCATRLAESGHRGHGQYALTLAPEAWLQKRISQHVLGRRVSETAIQIYSCYSRRSFQLTSSLRPYIRYFHMYITIESGWQVFIALALFKEEPVYPRSYSTIMTLPNLCLLRPFRAASPC